MISIEDFAKLELKVGTVLEAEAIEESENLLKLKIDIGEDPPAGGPRQILAGIKKWYKPESLVGKQVIIVANLEPRMMMGYESQGMLLAAEGDRGKPILLKPSSKVQNGTKIR